MEDGPAPSRAGLLGQDMDNESKLMRAAIAKHVYENIGFIQEQTGLFCASVREYAEALQASHWRRDERREESPPDGYMPAIPGDFFCLNTELAACRYMLIWRPIQVVHPLGCFWMPEVATNPPRKLNDDEILMRDCVVLGRVYHEEGFRAHPTAHAFPPACDCGFDLARFLMHLGSRLAQPDGDLMIQMAWDRVKDRLPSEDPAEAGELSKNNRGPYSFGPNYRSALWYGKDYAFTRTEAQLVEILVQAFEAGSPDVDAPALLGLSNDELKAKSKKESHAKRVRDIFRGNPAWGTMIVPGKGHGKKGTYHLQPPEVTA